MVRSSHKNSNSNKEEAQSAFHHFCPGLPVSLTLCPGSVIAKRSKNFNLTVSAVLGNKRWQGRNLYGHFIQSSYPFQKH
jgi:hypothetical protein